MGNKSAWQVEIGFRICGRYKGLRHAATRSGGFSGARGWCSSTRPGSRPTGAPLRSDGLTAPLRLRRPINARWGEPFLVSTLRSGDIGVLDNLGSHKGRPARQAIRGAGRKALVPATLLARPQPHRRSLRKDQARDARRPETHPRRRRATPRTTHRHHPAQPMPQRHPERTIRFRPKPMRSRDPGSGPVPQGPSYTCARSLVGSGPDRAGRSSYIFPYHAYRRTQCEWHSYLSPRHS